MARASKERLDCELLSTAEVNLGFKRCPKGNSLGETIANNKKAFHDYYIEEKFEAGIVLKGSEIKAIRAGRVNLKDSFIRIDNGEAVLFNAHIGLLETTHHYYRHEERGARKLLLHKKEILKLERSVQRDGLTIVPLSMYYNHKNIVKIEIGIAKGKQLHDKRQDLKEKDMKRDIDRAMKEQ
jgi:SsrA-binding protein